MSLSLFGLGLGWCLAYVAATTELVELAAPSERGRLIGFTDLLSSFSGAALALGGGVVYTRPAARSRSRSPPPGSRSSRPPGWPETGRPASAAAPAGILTAATIRRPADASVRPFSV